MPRLALVGGKMLSHKDVKVWQQAMAMLMGLKVRNGFVKRDLAGGCGGACAATRCQLRGLHDEGGKRGC